MSLQVEKSESSPEGEEEGPLSSFSSSGEPSRWAESVCSSLERELERLWRGMLAGLLCDDEGGILAALLGCYGTAPSPESIKAARREWWRSGYGERWWWMACSGRGS